MKTPYNSTKTPFYEVNKQINAFSGKRGGMHFQKKGTHLLKKDTKLFIYVIYIYLLYVYSISINFVYSLFILFSGSHTTSVAYSIAVSEYSGRSLW